MKRITRRESFIAFKNLGLSLASLVSLNGCGQWNDFWNHVGEELHVYHPKKRKAGFTKTGIPLNDGQPFTESDEQTLVDLIVTPSRFDTVADEGFPSVPRFVSHLYKAIYGGEPLPSNTTVDFIDLGNGLFVPAGGIYGLYYPSPYNQIMLRPGARRAVLDALIHEAAHSREGPYLDEIPATFVHRRAAFEMPIHFSGITAATEHKYATQFSLLRMQSDAQSAYELGTTSERTTEDGRSVYQGASLLTIMALVASHGDLAQAEDYVVSGLLDLGDAEEFRSLNPRTDAIIPMDMYAADGTVVATREVNNRIPIMIAYHMGVAAYLDRNGPRMDSATEAVVFAAMRQVFFPQDPIAGEIVLPSKVADLVDEARMGAVYADFVQRSKDYRE